jgi:hypothetical protein
MGDVPPREALEELRRLWLEGKFPKQYPRR